MKIGSRDIFLQVPPPKPSVTGYDFINIGNDTEKGNPIIMDALYRVVREINEVSGLTVSACNAAKQRYRHLTVTGSVSGFTHCVVLTIILNLLLK
jgi:hypothetical protein